LAVYVKFFGERRAKLHAVGPKRSLTSTEEERRGQLSPQKKVGHERAIVAAGDWRFSVGDRDLYLAFLHFLAKPSPQLASIQVEAGQCRRRLPGFQWATS